MIEQFKLLLVQEIHKIAPNATREKVDYAVEQEIIRLTALGTLDLAVELTCQSSHLTWSIAVGFEYYGDMPQPRNQHNGKNINPHSDWASFTRLLSRAVMYTAQYAPNEDISYVIDEEIARLNTEETLEAVTEKVTSEADRLPDALVVQGKPVTWDINDGFKYNGKMPHK